MNEYEDYELLDPESMESLPKKGMVYVHHKARGKWVIDKMDVKDVRRDINLGGSYSAWSEVLITKEAKSYNGYFGMKKHKDNHETRH